MYGWAQQLAAASNIQLGGGLNAVPLVSYGMYHSVPMAAPMPAPGVVPIGAAQPGPAAGAVPIGSGGGERGSVGERTITIVDPASNGTEGQSSAPAPDSSSVPIGVDNNNVVVANVELLKRARSMKEIGPESDFVQRILGFLRVVVDTYSIVISSLLSVFVPQFCDIKEEYKFCVEENPNDPSCDTHICRTQPLTLVCRQHECTAKENFEDLVPYNKFVLAWNFIALAVALVHYRIVWIREKWLIRYLDVSPIHSRVNLRHVIKYYPELEEGLSVQNRRTMISSIVWLIVAVINVIVSAILVFKFYYNNERTVTTFITSVLIIGQLSYQSLEITMLGLRHQVALSCLQFEPISFNIIDKDYKGKPDPTRMASGVSSVDAANQQPAGQ